MRGIDIEQVRQELSNYAVDPEWAGLSFGEKMECDAHRYFLEAREVCHEQAVRQIAEERGVDIAREEDVVQERQEGGHRARRPLAEAAISFVKDIFHTPQHRA